MTDKVTEINNFYTRILASIGMSVTPEGIIQLNDNGETPLTLFIDKKTAVIPIRPVLDNYDKATMVAWHPLAESTFRAETEVIKKTKKLVLHRMISDLQILSYGLLELAANHAAHAKLNPEQSRFLAIAADADEKSCAKFRQFWGKTNLDDNDFIRLFLSRSYEHNGTKYPRAALVSFPHVELLYPSDEDVQPTEILKVSLRKKSPNDLKIWGDIIEYILPHIRHRYHYSGFADSGELPYFNALLRAFLLFSHQTNKIAKRFVSAVPEFQSIIKDLSWEDDLIEADKWIGMIPDLDPDDGVIKPTPQSKPAVSPVGGMTRALVEQPPSAPSGSPVKAPEAETEGVPFIGSTAYGRPAYPVAPPSPYGQPGYGSGYAQQGPPLDAYGRPIYPPPPPPQLGHGYAPQPAYGYQAPQPYYQQPYGHGGHYPPVYDPNHDPNSRANRNRHR